MTEALAPLLIVNPYGLFATTTTTRPGHRLRGLGRQSNVARVRAAVPSRAGDARADMEHPLPAASRLAAVVCRLRQRRAAPLDRAPAAAPARRQPGRACALRGEPVRALGRRSTCARCSTTIASPMRDRRSEQRAVVGAPPRRHLLSADVACRFSSGLQRPSAPEPVSGTASETQTKTARSRTQLLETRSVSMIAVEWKALHPMTTLRGNAAYEYSDSHQVQG